MRDDDGLGKGEGEGWEVVAGSAGGVGGTACQER